MLENLPDKVYKSDLELLKERVHAWRAYFNENLNRYHTSRKFVFKQSLSTIEKQDLGTIQKPQFEFNVIESYLSRACAEFAKQEPSFVVHQAPDGAPVNPNLIKIIEGHLAAILLESKKELLEYQTYFEQMSGGFSVFKVETDYENPMSFNQKICLRKAYDPTMCGFDPLAKDITKADGEYCFEIWPFAEDDFKETFPKVDVTALTAGSIGDFSWSYTRGLRKIILVCRMYLKEEKYKNLCYLANNRAMLESDYNKLLKWWNENNIIEQPPKVLRKRKTKVSVIKCVTFYQNGILSEEETNYTYLPLIFVDGNSAEIREEGQGSDVTQFTRPYFYHAMDCQRLKNIAGQCAANELEWMVQNKWIAAKEGIPEQYLPAYLDPQKAAILIYNAFSEDKKTPIPPPQAVIRPPIPPEILQTFQMADQTIQNILGAFNTQLGVLDNDISGVALQEANTQSNQTAMPYVIKFLAALNQASKIIMDLMPKIYFNPRAIPMINQNRKLVYQGINGFDQNSINLDYSSHSLNVTVEAGVNFELQKMRAVNTLMMLGQAFPSVAQLINSKSLPILFDNLDFRGADQMKDDAISMMQQQQQAQQQQQQLMAKGMLPPNPLTLKQQEIQMKDRHAQAKTQIEQQRADIDKLKVALDYINKQQDHNVQSKKADVEAAVHGLEAHLKTQDQAHQHAIDTLGAMNDLMQTNLQAQQQEQMQQQPQQPPQQ